LMRGIWRTGAIGTIANLLSIKQERKMPANCRNTEFAVSVSPKEVDLKCLSLKFILCVLTASAVNFT
ncbi:MAG: hypothetical protein N2246_09610, partial [Candidatus Sumerlaeia bacterium]|nr:hypothetical protein [Candidatus Sumerlaeia bacterium]